MNQENRNTITRTMMKGEIDETGEHVTVLTAFHEPVQSILMPISVLFKPQYREKILAAIHSYIYSVLIFRV